MFYKNPGGRKNVADDELIETLRETLSDVETPSEVEGRRQRRERRSDKPSNYSGSERRGAADRRVLSNRRRGSERRTGVDRRHLLRRHKDQEVFQKRVEEGDLTREEIEFVRAVDRYKRKFNRPVPTWSEILAIVKELGYTKDSLS